MKGINLQAFMTSVVISSVFILLIMFFRALFRKKISMRLQYALWLLVAVNLLMIPMPKMESALSVQNIVNFKHEKQISQEATKEEKTITNKVFLKQETVSFSEQSKDSMIIENKENTQMQKEASKKKIEIDSFFMIIAFVGAMVMLVYVLFYNLYFYRFLHRQRMHFEGYESKLPIYLVEGLPSPCLYGKAIYITPEQTTNEKILKHVITHEYCHYRQGDLWWSVLRSVCLICYWWNPLVWLAAYLSKQDCELACDEAALGLLGNEERIPYGETLIGLITVKTKPQDYFSIATTMTGSKRSMRERIQRIAGKQRAVISICIVLVLLVGICFVSVSTDKKEENNDVLEYQEEALFSKQILSSSQTDDLTMDRVIAMFKEGNLGKVDYFSFANSEVYSKERAKEYGWLNYYVNFHLEYNGEGYHLGVSHSVEDDTLQDIYLTRDSDMESRLIYTAADKYTVLEDIEEYLNSKMQMSDLLSIDLPEGFTLGNYMANIGVDGGALIGPQAYEIKYENGYGSGIPEWTHSGAIMIIRYPNDWFVFGEGQKLDKHLQYYNHTYEEKVELLEGLAMPAVLYRSTHDLYTASESAELLDQGIELLGDELISEYWDIYFASKENEIAYCLSLDARQFSKQQVIDIAKSVRFAEVVEETQIIHDFEKIEELYSWFCGYGQIGRNVNDSLKKEKDGYSYFPVEQYDIHTMKELERYVKQYVTEEQAQALFIKHEPEIFFEDEGALYTLDGYIGNHYYQDGERSYELLYGETEQNIRLIVTISMETMDDEKQEVTMGYSMFQAENGQWKIEGDFELPIKVFLENANNFQ